MSLIRTGQLACRPMSRDISCKYLGFPVLATEGTMATGYNVRVGDADREAVAAQLREHYADGRLTLEELNERLDQTFAAKTKADLNTVMRDLPQAARPTTGVPYGGTAWQGQAWKGPVATRPGPDYGNGWGNGQRSCGPGVFAPSRARCIGSRRLCSRCRSGPIALATNACTDDACRRFRGAPPRTVGLTRLDMKSATAPWRGSRPSGQPARQPWGFFVFLMPSARLTSDVRV